MNHVDVAPTSLGLAGIAVPQWMEGTDYSHIRAAPLLVPHRGDTANPSLSPACACETGR
jgi:hypothetical protein